MASQTCTAQVLRGAIYEECGAAVGADGVCARGHGDHAVDARAERHRRAPEINLTAGVHPVTRKFFSVDDHIVEPADVWSKRVPAKYRDRAPHVVEADGRQFWQYEDTRTLTMGLNAVAGKPRDQWTMEPARFTDMIPGCYDPVARARDMVSDGVTASVCFPTLPRFGGVLFNDFADKALADVCVKAWNDFLLEEWCAAAPDLYVPMPICQIWDPVAAAVEIRRNVDRGARALCFPEETSFLGLPSFYSDHWDPIWEAVTEADIPVCMHIGSSGNMAYQPADAPFTLSIALAFVAAAQSSISLMMSPVPRKFPTIKFVMSEGGIGWVPAALERADRQIDRHRYWSGDDDLMPSEVCRRNFWFCMIEEPWALQATRYEIGVDRILWECDYPHADTTFPNTQVSTKVVFDGIPEEEIDLITYRNAERLFRWKCREPGDVRIGEA
jgi:predicted TIM-barrel fold metal-dependent hydrolase